MKNKFILMFLALTLIISVGHTSTYDTAPIGGTTIKTDEYTVANPVHITTPLSDVACAYILAHSEYSHDLVSVLTSAVVRVHTKHIEVRPNHTGTTQANGTPAYIDVGSTHLSNISTTKSKSVLTTALVRVQTNHLKKFKKTDFG